ncbi:alpha/beta hydrolase [uncultured Sphingomonas sp.]|uniref:alpha/beta hydrolase n=1 Tax=uncultured Sphingomonas sp. TaxID=158754 RepID=UPI002629819E|nr:alpha/beta hydrolase [uncultured Sphingomonas sp.]
MELHPIAVATLEAIAASGQTPYHLSTPQEARADVSARLRAVAPRPHPGIARIETIAVPGAVAPITCRRYTPIETTADGAIVYAHGGGWVFGAPELFDPLCSWLAVAAQCPVISVDYRLAPETRFPGALEDIAAAVRALANGPASVVVAGDSAGGNLAAAAALMLADCGDATIAGQILLYPVLDHDFETTSYRALGDAGRIISTADMRWFWDQYARSSADRMNPLASPLRAPRVDHLPPTYVAVGGWDPLHDEGVSFCERLKQAGVPVKLDDFADMMHGFCSQAGLLDRADHALARAGECARRWLGRKKGRSAPR